MNTPTTRYRWTICTLLFFATTINYIDRQILSLVKPLLDDELHWTNEQFGMVNSAFQAAYAIGLLGFGRLIDRFGTKIGYALSITLWSIAAMSHALVGSIAGFRWARMFLGVSEAGNFPAAIKTVAQWFPRSERAFATTLFNSGANVGAIIAPATIPFIAAAWGWRAAFVAAGLAGFVWLVFWWLMYEAPEKHARVSPAELAVITSDRADTQTDTIPWLTLLKIPQTWSFIIAKFLTDPVWWFFLIWLPDYFNKTKGLDIKKLGLPLVTIYVIVTVLSIAGGWLANALVRRGWSENRTRKTCMFIFALAVLPILLVKGAGLWGAVVLIGIAGAAHQAWSANLFTTVSDMFPKRAIGTVIGIGGMAGSFGGILFPIYSGRLLDRFTASGDVNTGYAILFGICAAAYLLAFGLNHLFAKRFAPITQLES
ncbi:MAG: MFS transporter [Prosthecobacter sp.]|uniref:MFS transporter n=1 Tax=Prosthecobacter sp. TaxID=1965333 RepID=UPI0038FFF371